MTTLPKGWSVTTIDRIADINPRHPRHLDDSLRVTFVRMPALSEADFKFRSTEERFLGKVRTGFTHFAEGDVLFAKITPCMENGKAAIAWDLVNGLGCGTTELHVLRLRGGIEPKYIYHFIHRDSFREEAALNFTGSAGQLRVPVAYVSGSRIPLPPLNEQRRIVASLEAVLTRVEAAQARLATIPNILKRFRQSVLAEASSGKLTADWRLKNSAAETSSEFVVRLNEERKAKYEIECEKAKRLNQRKPKLSHHTSFVPFIQNGADDIPADWCVTRIGDVGECLDYQRIPVNRDERLTRQGTIPYYGANGQTGWINDYLFDEELVLVVEDETFTGRETPFSYVITGKSWVNNHAHIIRPCGGISAHYLNICWSYYDFTPLTSGTTGRRKLTQEALLDVVFPVAPLAEQNEIVRRVEALFKIGDALEARYSTAKTHVDKLSQSILAKAFRGELVPQDPNDEPASVLLERIRCAKAASFKAKANAI